MHILKSGALYFVLVFGAGFVLGTIRVLWIVPSVGVRMAELMEAPLMLAVTIVAAGRVLRRPALRAARLGRLGIGLVALGLLLAAEFTLVLGLQGLTVAEYLASRDPVAGTVYVAMLAVFALMPLLVGGR